MVKNQGGNKSKKMGRKFLSAPVDKRVRLAEEEGEIYASVTKLLGNGMFYAVDPEGKEKLVVMRNKFRGRGKRDNSVTVGGWVLIGVRDFESSSKPKHDLLEVYNDSEKTKLKNSGNPIFGKLKNDHDKNSDNEDDEDFVFTTRETEKYQELSEQIENMEHTTNNVVVMDTGEDVDIDDI